MYNEQRSPHALSLPLFTVMQRADESSSIQEAVTKLLDGITSLHIENHVHPVISFDHDRETLSVEAKDDFGRKICLELMDRFGFPPCPAGECQPCVTGFCQWCGKDVSCSRTVN